MAGMSDNAAVVEAMRLAFMKQYEDFAPATDFEYVDGVGFLNDEIAVRWWAFKAGANWQAALAAQPCERAEAAERERDQYKEIVETFPLIEDDLEAATRELAELRAEREGWQWVPKEPTPEMLAGMWSYSDAVRVWKQMLAAAPKGSEPRSDGVERCPCGYPQPCGMSVPIGFCRATPKRI